MTWHVAPRAARRATPSGDVDEAHGVLGRGARRSSCADCQRGDRRRSSTPARLQRVWDGRRGRARRAARAAPSSACSRGSACPTHVARLLARDAVAAAVVARRACALVLAFAVMRRAAGRARACSCSSCSRRCCRSPASRPPSGAASTRPTRSRSPRRCSACGCCCCAARPCCRRRSRWPRLAALALPGSAGAPPPGCCRRSA